MISIHKYRKNWDNLAKKNPLWAILTDKKNWDKKSFFDTGKQEIAQLFKYLKINNIKVNPDLALDFGCGLGRLTQALCLKFNKVIGVDISTEMIRLAENFNRFNNRCSYFQNTSSDLKRFKSNSFSFVYSNITLQHNHPRFILKYLKEFIRVLKKNGICVFQLPSKPALTVKGIIIRLIPDPILDKVRGMEMHGIEKNKVVDFLSENGVKILLIEKDVFSNSKNGILGQGWESYKYFFTK